jgi:hypothetical protein
MATITISAEDLQSHLDDGNVVVVGFEWNKYHGAPSVEVEVTADYTIEDDEYVTADKYEKVADELALLQEEHTLLKYNYIKALAEVSCENITSAQ